jgi:hypothetical protein
MNGVLVAIAVAMAPLTPYTQSPNLGDLCYNWHATATDSSGNTLVCTHTPDSGHLMYWESRVMDR